MKEIYRFKIINYAKYHTKYHTNPSWIKCKFDILSQNIVLDLFYCKLPFLIIFKNLKLKCIMESYEYNHSTGYGEFIIRPIERILL